MIRIVDKAISFVRKMLCVPVLPCETCVHCQMDLHIAKQSRSRFALCKRTGAQYTFAEIERSAPRIMSYVISTCGAHGRFHKPKKHQTSEEDNA